MSVAIMTDTNSGLTPEQAKELGVYLLPMPILIDGNAYYEHQSITPKEFYEKMRAKADISTTQPSPADLMDLWEEILKTHDEVVHIPMSSGLSNSCETAMVLAQEYHGRGHVVFPEAVRLLQVSPENLTAVSMWWTTTGSPLLCASQFWKLSR